MWAIGPSFWRAARAARGPKLAGIAVGVKESSDTPRHADRIRHVHHAGRIPFSERRHRCDAAPGRRDHRRQEPSPRPTPSSTPPAPAIRSIPLLHTPGGSSSGSPQPSPVAAGMIPAANRHPDWWFGDPARQLSAACPATSRASGWCQRWASRPFPGLLIRSASSPRKRKTSRHSRQPPPARELTVQPFRGHPAAYRHLSAQAPGTRPVRNHAGRVDVARTKSRQCRRNRHRHRRARRTFGGPGGPMPPSRTSRPPSPCRTSSIVSATG